MYDARLLRLGLACVLLLGLASVALLPGCSSSDDEPVKVTTKLRLQRPPQAK